MTRPSMPTPDDELRRIWRAAGGKFHGPHVEHGYMEEAKLLPFLRGLVEPQTGGGDARLSPEAIAHLNAEVDAGGSIGPDDVERAAAAYPAAQTGDGDAPAYDDEISAEQIAALNRIVPDAAFADHETISGPAWGVVDAGERARERLERLVLSCQRGEQANRVLIRDVCEEALAALRSSHREGATAMREACAQEVGSGRWMSSTRYDGPSRIRALPIPE